MWVCREAAGPIEQEVRAPLPTRWVLLPLPILGAAVQRFRNVSEVNNV